MPIQSPQPSKPLKNTNGGHYGLLLIIAGTMGAGNPPSSAKPRTSSPPATNLRESPKDHTPPKPSFWTQFHRVQNLGSCLALGCPSTTSHAPVQSLSIPAFSPRTTISNVQNNLRLENKLSKVPFEFCPIRYPVYRDQERKAAHTCGLAS